jgi:GNAT superfamily N-acetyltransferase
VNPVEVRLVPGRNLRETLRLLEEWLRDGEPVRDSFVAEIRRHLEVGDLEVLAARLEGRVVGVLVLAFRPNIALGAPFASIEDLYVRPQARRRGVGGTLLQAAYDRCTSHEISYLEAQVEEGAARYFYEASGFEPERGVRVLSRSLPIGGGDEELKADS